MPSESFDFFSMFASRERRRSFILAMSRCVTLADFAGVALLGVAGARGGVGGSTTATAGAASTDGEAAGCVTSAGGAGGSGKLGGGGNGAATVAAGASNEEVAEGVALGLLRRK